MEKAVVEKLRKAGELAAQVREYALTLIEEDARIKDISDKIENRIFELGGKPAFPVCVSINEVAAHQVPGTEDRTVLKKGDLVKIDLGVHVDGYIADTAVSVSVGKNAENEKLIEATKIALAEALKLAKPGVKVCEIGGAISQAITAAGFRPVKNLFGHCVERYNLHAGANIPNYDNKDETEIEAGMVLAVEPFATTGEGFVEDTKNVEVYKVAKQGNVRANRDILKYVLDEYNLLPFARRWLTKKFGILKTNLFLKEAAAKGILYEHHALVERSNGKVAQTEHTVIVSEKPEIITA